MLAEGVFALFYEKLRNLTPISHATAMSVGERQCWHAA
jgi:hypothetical protein